LGPLLDWTSQCRVLVFSSNSITEMHSFSTIFFPFHAVIGFPLSTLPFHWGSLKMSIAFPPSFPLPPPGKKALGITLSSFPHIHPKSHEKFELSRGCTQTSLHSFFPFLIKIRTLTLALFPPFSFRHQLPELQPFFVFLYAYVCSLALFLLSRCRRRLKEFFPSNFFL